MKTDIREGRRDARTDFRVLFGALIAVALAHTPGRWWVPLAKLREKFLNEAAS